MQKGLAILRGKGYYIDNFHSRGFAPRENLKFKRVEIMNKSKFLKKSLAMLLALMLVVAMIPLSASAAELPNMGSIYVNGSVVKLPEGNSGTMTVDIGEDDNSLTIGTNYDLSEYDVELVVAIMDGGVPEYTTIGRGVPGTPINDLSKWAPDDVMTLEVYPTDGRELDARLAQYTLKLNRTKDATTTNLKEVKAVENSGVYSIDNTIEEINATRTIKVTAAYDDNTNTTAPAPQITVTGDENATINATGNTTETVGAADDAKLEVVSQSGNNTAEYIIETTYVDALNTITVNGVEGVITDTNDDDHNDLITVTLPKDAVLDEYGDPITDPKFEVAFTMYAKTGTISIDSGDAISSPATVKFTGLADGKDYEESLVTTVIGGVKQTYNLKVTIAKDNDTTIDRVLIQTPGQNNVNELGYPEGDEINIEVPENATLTSSTVTLYTSTTVEKVSVAGTTLTSGYTDEDGLRKWTFNGVDLTSSKIVTITAQNNTIQDYTLTVTKATEAKRPAIESFSIEDPETGIVYSGTPNEKNVIELEKIPYMTTNIGNWVVRVTPADGTTVVTSVGYAIPSGQYTVNQITSPQINSIGVNGCSFEVTATDRFDTDYQTYTIKVSLEEPGSGKTLDTLSFTSQKTPAEGDKTVFRALNDDNTFDAKIDQSKKEIILRPALSLAQTGYNHYVTGFTTAEGAVAFYCGSYSNGVYSVSELKAVTNDDNDKTVTGQKLGTAQTAVGGYVVVVPEKIARDALTTDNKISNAEAANGTVYEVVIDPAPALKEADLKTFKIGDVELKVSGNTISGTIPWSYTVPTPDDANGDKGYFAEFTMGKYAEMSSVAADEKKKIVNAVFHSKGDTDGDGEEDLITVDGGKNIFDNFKFVFVRGANNTVDVYQTTGPDASNNLTGSMSDHPISVIVKAEDRLSNEGKKTSKTYKFELKYADPEINANIDSFKLGKYEGTISGTNINVRVPYNTDLKGMIATFTTSTGAKVYYNGDKKVPVKSGETVLNYSSPVKLVVHSEKTKDGKLTGDSVTVKTYTVTVTEAEMFSDVSSSKWYYDYVLQASNLGIINGKGDGIFAPEEDVTRGDFAVMLTNMLGVTELPHVVNNPFADVNEDIYYSDAIAYCYEQGYIGGYPDGSYRPEATITRQEAAKIIAEALGLTETDSDPFTDDNLIHEWAEDYVCQCKAAGIFGGDAETGNFRPSDAISRAETAKIMVVAYNNK